MVSSELPELLQVADRILVMRQGRMTGELPGRTTQEEIMGLATLEHNAPSVASDNETCNVYSGCCRCHSGRSVCRAPIASPHFLTETNLSSVVRQTAVINIMALGMTLVIITGGIDLSVARSSRWRDCSAPWR